MRRDVQEIFKQTPHDKQVMMFTATLNKDIRSVCRKFMTTVRELFFIIFITIIISSSFIIVFSHWKYL